VKRKVSLLTEWIKQGAQYDKHWSYKSTSTSLKSLTKEHPVDFFIDQRLKKEGTSQK
jgi:hypothetical protein